MTTSNKLKRFFDKPKAPLQRKYEALRSIFVDTQPYAFVAKKYGYSIKTVYSLVRDFKAGKISFFQAKKPGPISRKMPKQMQQLVLNYRKENLSAKDINSRLEQAGYKCSTRTVERVLADVNIPKLPRRTHIELGKSLKNTLIAERCVPLDFAKLKPFRYDCPVAGVFFFLPYLLESGILDIVKQSALPQSSDISAEQACLSMLLLKLVGSERLSHIESYDHEPGLGVFAGLNLLPKKSFMATYSCRTSEELLKDFQQQLMQVFKKKYPDFYQSSFINLDFHSIPHFGDQSQMEKVWCGARSKAIKGVNTMFAQDSDSNAIIYTHADILRKNETEEIRKFVTYWKTIKNAVNETLVFDCKLTSYNVLDDLSKDGIKFITLRKRTQTLISNTEKIPEKEWQKIYLPIPKRKHKTCMIHVSEITLPKCTSPVRQIIVTHHGRAQPTYVITNNMELAIKDILIVYAKRWHIEQKFAELVSFFNLNALSSPLMIRIHFDILWTVIADTLYHRFSQDLPRFEHGRADSIFRHFVNMPGQVTYDGKEFIVKIRKRAHTPILLGVKRLQQSVKIPWLDNRSLRIEWTA
jgi:transposase